MDDAQINLLLAQNTLILQKLCWIIKHQHKLERQLKKLKKPKEQSKQELLDSFMYTDVRQCGSDDNQ